ncbi:hypothetical protein [Bacillus cereus]
MLLKGVTTILDKLQNEKYEIHNYLTTVLRITRKRLDIKEVLFLELSNISMSQ